IHINHSDKIGEYMSKVIGGKREISADEAEGIGSIDAFIEMLRGTPYYTPLSVFCGKPKLQEPFYMETALDTYWANMVYKYAKKYLTPDEAKSVIKVYGTEFDLQNLTFLLRCKRTFKMTDEGIYASVIPKYYRLKGSTISKIVKSPSYSDAISIIADETPYGSAFSEEDRFIEKRQGGYIADMKRRMNYALRFSIQSAICYIHLRRTEIDNIVSIIEGIRYDLGAEKIAEYLIGYKRKEARV
ncbi:MAG: V-type ATPase subunit, partial [Clostridia bacterium]|nr:V-type ATPase subunit [Clostridia bacterium]